MTSTFRSGQPTSTQGITPLLPTASTGIRVAFLALCLPVAGPLLADDDFPIVPADLEVSLFAKDPLVRNPCALAFDGKGRLCVGMGPQYRKPTPGTPGDSVWILIDEDGNGTADSRKEYASGFNSIQGLAWRGGDLYVANAPELTIARDLDGDDEADEYVRLYTDLGNLEHGLHGLNFGPDGKLYMSKGNSKGFTQPPHRVAPQPFRDLWGVKAPGLPDFPAPITYKKGHYQKNYHDPADDWGLSGGILRCDPDGSNLEIVSRGFRNPWDICFDDEFNWLGTDNDQTLGDKIFSPFFGAHFGWGHMWAYDWQGDQHLPTAPSAGPLFEGSGTGVIYCGLESYPEKYRDIFLINDWLRREVYLYRPRWVGAWMRSDSEKLKIFAHAGGGRTMGQSEGRRFDPVDLELGPDGAVYIASWGRQYGLKEENGRQVNEGRIYRIWPKAAPPDPSAAQSPHRRKPMVRWTPGELFRDLGSHVPAWRTNAQMEVLAREIDDPDYVIRVLPGTKRLETWKVWTMGRRNPGAAQDATLLRMMLDPSSQGTTQVMRLLAHRVRARGGNELPDLARSQLESKDARRRHETVLAMWQVGETRWNEDLLRLIAHEKDRVVFYSAWGALRELMPNGERRRLLSDPRPAVRRAALLSLLEEDTLADPEIRAMLTDSDRDTAALAKVRLGGKAQTEIRGSSLERGADPENATEAGRSPGPRPVSVVSNIQSRERAYYEEAYLTLGTHAYTDRRYRIKDLPSELEGLTFIRAANNDADHEHGSFLKINLRYPSTVFLADDMRGGQLPAWARGKWAPTKLVLSTDDASHRLFKAEFPAGEVLFGPNREGVEGRKSNYLVIPMPKILAPPQQPSTVKAVLPLIAKANAERGRALFLSRSGADCARCHKLEGIGNVFAPDLHGIATRATAEFIVRSILEPSAAITEGFVLHVVKTRSGEHIPGIVIKETARAVTLALMDSSTRVVATNDITSRETIPTSAMPPVFAQMLTPQDVADLTAYLLIPKENGSTQTTPPPPAETEAAPTGKASPLAGKQWGNADKGFSLACDEMRLAIHFDGTEIASYYYRHPETKRPFFAHVKTPGGIQVTRNFPPRKGVDPTDHGAMHPGIALGFANFEGVSFWHNSGGIVIQEKFAGEPEAGQQANWTVENRYLAPGGREMCRETASYRISKNRDGFLISMDSRLHGPKPFWLGVREEMGLAMRVATPIMVKNKGSILSAGGGRDEKGTWGKVDRWWDYYGPLGDKSAGIQLMSGPGNPPVWSHSRDYGVLVANPLPVDRDGNRDKKVVVEPGEEFRLRFGIQIHEHDKREQFDPEGAYRRYLKLPE